MDKEHLIELISSSLIKDNTNLNSNQSYTDMKNYLEKLNLDQLRTMSKEFIL